MTTYGLSDEQMRLIESFFRKHLGEKPFKVWVFGSRATGKFKKFSDVDLLVECNSLNPVILSRIRGDFEDSNFPYKADIVDIRSLAADYAAGINKDRQLLFENS